MLNADAGNAAVRLALAETQIVNETKEFLEKHGISTDAFGRKERSDTVILVKNTPYGTSEDDLRDLFGKFGDLGRVLIPPAKTMAVVEFLEPSEARAAFKGLAYRRFKDSLIYLEKAPEGLFQSKVNPEDVKEKTVKRIASGSELLDVDTGSESATLFVKNLNFSTKPETLRRAFMGIDGYRASRINVKPDAKRPGQTLSMGFGFIEFDSTDAANKALKAMQGYVLDGHALQLKFSHAKSSDDKAVKKQPETTKIIIRNIPFEATSKDLRELLGAYGQLKSLRLPKKLTGGHRGFAFADFMTKQEAKNVYNSMSAIHLYGRHLVLEWAKDEDDVESLRAKAGRDLAAEEAMSGRKRRKVDLSDDEDDSMDEA